ncbi:MAG: hypothetical protein ACE5JU_14055, partial [Candidatus Binatia bacterium]
TPDLACPAERIIQEIKAYDREACLFIGDGARVYGRMIEDSLGKNALVTLGESYPSTAFSVACMAEERVRKGEFDLPGPLVPLYLRPSEAELAKKR